MDEREEEIFQFYDYVEDVSLEFDKILMTP